jgi:hypothetical protein
LLLLSGDADLERTSLSADGLRGEGLPLGLRERSLAGDFIPPERELEPLLLDATDLERLLCDPGDSGLCVGLDGGELDAFEDDEDDDDESESAIVQMSVEWSAGGREKDAKD